LSTILYAEYESYQGSEVYVGSHNSSPGGEKRSQLKGGLFLGEKSEGFRGVQLHNEGNSAWVFLKEKSKLGQSLLATLQPNPLTVNVESVHGSNQVKAIVNNFSNSFFSEGAIVHFGLKQYRIKNRISDQSVELCEVKKMKCVDFTFKDSFRDNLVLPSFYFISKAEVMNDTVLFTGGDFVPAFSKFDFNHQLVSVKIEDKWFFAKANNKKHQLILNNSPRPLGPQEIEVIVRYQPSYTVQFSLKRTSGQGLEETWFIRSDYDAWRYRSSGSGVAINKPHVFQVGIKDVLEIQETGLKSNVQVTMPGIVLGNEKSPNVEILFGKGDPNGKISASVGSIFMRTDGTKGDTFYVKESGERTDIGWVSK
jgi:hypothetical protein